MAVVIKARNGMFGAPRSVSLEDKYDLRETRVFISGPQAILRILLTQKEMDRRAGLRTAGFISGYRGSPLGGLDLTFERASPLLTENDIVFQPGLNEDLAATAVWGAQQAEMRGEGLYDGVFALWYGKGPRRRSLGRCVPPCQCRRHLAPRRRARPDGRRPHGRIFDDGASIRIHARRCDDADPLARRRRGAHRLRPLWLCHEPLYRHLGRHQMSQRDDRIRPPPSMRGSAACSRSCRATSFCRPAAST